MASAKKAPAKKAPAKKVSAKSTVSKKAATPAKKAAVAKPSAPKKAASPAKKVAGPAKKGAPQVKKAAAPLKKSAAPVKKAAAPAKKAAAPIKKAAAPLKKAAPPAKKAPVAAKKVAAPPHKAAAPVKKAAAPAKRVSSIPSTIEIPAVKGVTKDGVAYTKDFDVKFLTAQRALLIEEKAALLGQAVRLEDEANSLIEEQEMGDVQFDDEGGEGDTMVVERERDLTLSAQARQTIADIDTALSRLAIGSYGYSTESGRPIPRERLQAIPWATMLVEEKVGGIGRR
ncbi:MAG: TraR/DksA family transcriptional regulator [Ilumatobacteraceae bacterium]